LLRVIEPPPQDLPDSAHGIYPHRVFASIASHAQDYLEGLAIPLKQNGLSVSSIVREGNPAFSIVSEGAKEPDTLIALTTHGRSGISRWLLGSVTDKVFHATTNPLLIVRAQEPEKFNPEVKLTDIIVPLDGSALAEQVLPLAVSITKALGLKMTLFQATPSVENYYPLMGSSRAIYNYDDLVRETDEEAAKYLVQKDSRLRQEGISTVEVQLMHGRAEIAITAYAREVPHCLVAMTTHGRSGIGRWMLGSVADRVIRHSGAPVLVVRSSEQEK
jgi:nucleotide-binding universal stress UspA family protein